MKCLDTDNPLKMYERVFTKFVPITVAVELLQSPMTIKDNTG